MAGKKVPDRIINYNAYYDGYLMLGIADVELPNITPLVETLSGAGILGEMETPLPGMIEAMEATINWRISTKYAIKLAAPGTHNVEFRAAQQIMSSANGYEVQAYSVSMGLMNKEFALGKLEPNSTGDNGQTFSVAYLRVYLDGKKFVDIDQLNDKFEINGKDYMVAYRRAVGLA